MLSKKKKVLGRGLGALIGSPGPATAGGAASGGAKEPEAAGRFFLCPLGEIAPGAGQPRKRFDERALTELAGSIRANGVIEPLIVRRVGGSFELIAGERRLRAAGMAGLAEVPVVVTDATDEESLEFAIIENIQREDLNAIEEAEAYRSLMDFGLSQEEVARRVGKDRTTVANYLRLLKLPLEIKEEIVGGVITMGHARAILSLDGRAAQTELCRRVISRGLSVRETERLAGERAAKAGSGGKRQAAAALDPDLASVEAELRDIFGTRVTLKERGGKGKIEISFYSAEERERVIDIIRSLAD
ncbi:MAG: ParB/RepB/Spo0J family partition protein [Thermodesulfobacteriota bacterium]